MANWFAPVVLVLAVMIALIAAYSVRPFVQIDLGDYYDSVYLRDFHAREVGAVDVGVSSAWPAGATTMTLEGGRPGIWMLTVHLAAHQPDDAIELFDLEVSGRHLRTVRRDARSFVALVPAEVATRAPWELRLVPALSGGAPAPPNLVGSVEAAPAQTYRWSQGASRIELPGLGRGDWIVSLTAVVDHPDGGPIDATIAANGVPVAQLPEQGGLKRFQFMVPAALVPDGNLSLEISARTFEDPRPLGVLIEQVSVAPTRSGAWVPPVASLLASLTLALGAYVVLLRLARRQWLAAGIVLGLIVAGAWALASARFPTVLMLPRLALLALWSVGLLLALERLVGWGFRRAGAPLSPLMLRGLLLIFFAGYWLKAGGMLYPYFVAIDMHWHMERARWIVEGQLPLLYGTNSPLNESTMPTAEWGENRPVIPYSPWFHMFAATFAFLPVPMVLAGNMFSALVDCSRVFLIALLGRAGGLNERGSFLAALLYAVTPATFLLHSWGNLPTTFGMWWTLVSTIYIVVAYRRLDRPRPFATLTLLLLITLLIYTVMATFMLLFLGLLVPALLLLRPADQHRRPALAIGLSTAAALGLATLIYYGQYIEPIIEQTIPYFTRAAAPGNGIEGVQYDPFGLYLVKYVWRTDYPAPGTSGYGLWLPIVFGLIGMWMVPNRMLRIAFGCWLVVAAAFLIVGARISMVDKHLFYLIPALVTGTGLLWARLWQRGLAARVMIASVYLFTFVSALQLWLHRIESVRQ